jgi:hypothetical protein
MVVFHLLCVVVMRKSDVYDNVLLLCVVVYNVVTFIYYSYMLLFTIIFCSISCV